MKHGDDELNPQDAEFGEALQRLLRDHERPLDYVSASRLAAARARAVAAAGQRRAARWWWALPPTAAAAALVAVLALRAPTPPGPRPIAQAETLELLGEDGEALAMYEDLDFYQWLSENDGAI